MLIALVCIHPGPVAVAASGDDTAAGLFAEFGDRIFEVSIVDIAAQEKSGHGTGFLIAEDGLIATNFHVVVALIDEPDKYRLEFVDSDGNTGPLELIDFDVVNDLALVRAAPFDREPLRMLQEAPAQGETIYSLGNPLDIGFSVVPGTYNGLARDSYQPRIHFSGSINFGMSGGPVLNRAGEVAGINVSTAFNQVSFLVPVSALRALVGDTATVRKPVTDLTARIRQQLIDNQRRMIGGMLEREWPTKTLGGGIAIDEMQPYVKCWGQSSDEDYLFSRVVSSCASGDPVTVGAGLQTGVVAYQFFWLEAGDLGATRFHSYYQSLFSGFMPDNYGDEDNLTDFSCQEQFVGDDSDHVDKVVVCVRAYRKYAGLYDALYLRGSVDRRREAYISHFTLAGVERDMLAAFLERFQQVARR